MISIWFWYAKVYDFLMVLESLRFFDMILIWFSYGFGVSPFSWYDFLMVLGCLRLFDMISLLFSSGHISHPRRRTPATPPTPPSSDPSHTSHARRRTHLPSRRQTVEPLRNSLISNFGFFLILLDLQARCSMLQTYRVQFEYKFYHFVGEAGKKKRFS